MSQYRHTQPAYLIRYMFMTVAGVAVLITLIAGDGAAWRVVGVLMAILVILGWLFSSLTVEVSADHVSWYFGPGFWKKKLDRHDIEAVSPVGTHCWYGWGIRYTPQGWMYNVSGLKAVKLTLRSGKTILIGTDEPEMLAAALEK